jgi:hypothetical protein
MNWRMLVLCGAFLSGALIACDLPIDSGNSQPWDGGGRGGYGGGGGGYGGYPDYDRGYQVEDERAWERAHEHYSCAEVQRRLDYDRQKLSGIDPSKHHKAAQWYRDDIYEAEQDWHECQREHRLEADHRRQEEERYAHEAAANAQAACAKLRSRVANDRAKLAEIDPSKHHKAAKYYQDDLHDAERQLAACH